MRRGYSIQLNDPLFLIADLLHTFLNKRKLFLNLTLHRMTRVSGHRLIQTPCCGSNYRTPIYASINFLASECWTDGQRIASLFPADGGLRKCLCGRYYLLQTATVSGRAPKAKARPPKDWDKKCDSWLWRFQGKPNREQIYEFYDTRPVEVIEREQKSLPPPAVHVPDNELPEILLQCHDDVKMTVTARRRYWRYLNTPFRETYRKHKEESPETFPAFQPTDEQRENMEQLLDFLTATQSDDHLEIIELNRELGQATNAIQLLENIQDDREALVGIQRRMTQIGYCGPVRYG